LLSSILFSCLYIEVSKLNRATMEVAISLKRLMREQRDEDDDRNGYAEHEKKDRTHGCLQKLSVGNLEIALSAAERCHQAG
jgi:hypothetical protein